MRLYQAKCFLPAICVSVMLVLLVAEPTTAQDDVRQDDADLAVRQRLLKAADPMRAIQSESVKSEVGIGHRWGIQPDKFSTWTNHSNRLIPVYTFGITLDRLRDRGSAYTSPKRLRELFGRVPKSTYNPVATYHDQTELYDLQIAALDAGCTNIIVLVFDGMDWQTTRAAAIYNDPDAANQSGADPYTRGRGAGLSFLEYKEAVNDFGWVVTTPYCEGATYDVNQQKLAELKRGKAGGYCPNRGGASPWFERSDKRYLIGRDPELPHGVTDSASSASSIFSGLKTYNGSINVAPTGEPVESLARTLQKEMDWMVGIVTSVPVSHATPAAVYANNVTRKDYQDISRDLIGLPSSFHPDEPLRGVDVLIGAGYGEGKEKDKLQGENFRAGNSYLHEDDMNRVNVQNGGEYVVATRSEGKPGGETLLEAAQRAADEDLRLLGFYGVERGQLPYQTADGQYDPTFDVLGGTRYSDADRFENPTLAEMTRAALTVLENSIEGFYLAIEAGDVDWANHANNLDNSVGAVRSGEEAFRVVTDWVEENNAWDHTAVIVTADHGHFLVIDDARLIQAAGRRAASRDGDRQSEAGSPE